MTDTAKPKSGPHKFQFFDTCPQCDEEIRFDAEAIVKGQTLQMCKCLHAFKIPEHWALHCHAWIEAMKRAAATPPAAGSGSPSGQDWLNNPPKPNLKPAPPQHSDD